MEDRMDRMGFRYKGHNRTPVSDSVANEAPLKTSCDSADGRLYGTLMRTPGEDKALIIGLMTGEGDLRENDPLPRIQTEDGNVHVLWEGVPSHRSLDSTSSCGMCGREEVRINPIEGCGSMPDINVDDKVIYSITLKESRDGTLYNVTGSAHSATSYALNGEEIQTMEDVGRHNALDKLVGIHRINSEWPMSQHIVSLSGRVSFEMVEKAVRSNIPILMSVGGATSAAIDLAAFHQLTLIVFAREGRFTVMTGAHRIVQDESVK